MRRCSRATRDASRPRTATRASTSSRWRTGCGPSSATTSPRSRRASGATATSCAQLQRRPRPHRRALRHVVLRADAARARARSRRCSPTSTSAASTYEHDGATWLRTPSFGDQRDRVLVKSDGSTDVPLQRPRLPPRQVRAGLGAPHRHLGRRPPRPGEVAPGRAARRSGSPGRTSPRSILGQLVKLAARRRGRAAVEARRQHHHARRHPRRGRPRRRPAHVPAPGHRHRADVRPRRRHRAVDGEPRLLRAVRARADRVDRPQGRRARRSSAPPIARRRPRAARARARARPAARARGVPRGGRRGRGDCARRTGSPPGCASFAGALPRLLPRLPGDHRRRRAHPGAALARRGVPDRARRRARRSSASHAPDEMRRLDDDDDERRGRAIDATAPFDHVARARRRCCDLRPRARSAAEFGTPLFVYDEDDLRRRCREYVGALRRRRTSPTRARRSCARRWRASSTRRASTSTSPPAASCTSRCTPAFPPERIVLHGNNKTRRRARSRARRRRRAHRRRLLRRARPARAARAARVEPARRARAGDAGRRGAHARVHRDRHRDVEVRVHGRGRRRAAGPSPRSCERRALTFARAALPHRVADLPCSTSYAPRGRDRRRARGRDRDASGRRRSTS